MATGECTLAELQADEYTFVQSEDEIKVIAAGYIKEPSGITGAVVKASCGQFDEVWLTDSSRPFELKAAYFRVA